MRTLYRTLTTLLAPVAHAVVLARGLRDRAYWHGHGERFGRGSRTRGPALWLHAVSLGEVAAAAELVRALRARHPGTPFVLTTATPTGRARALALFGAEIEVRYLPYDTPGAVRRFLDRIRPQVAVIVETELWPTLVHECARRAIPVVFASARLTARSVSRYRRFGGLFRETVAAAALIAAQTSEDAQRFIAVGADPARVRVVGNLKFDLRPGDALRLEGEALRRDVLRSRTAWVAASTHAGEEEQVLAAHAELRREMPELLLLLVPRHPQRFEAVAGLLSRLGVTFDRRSAGTPVRPQAEVLLVDSVGELTAFYAAAQAAFVGGSLVPVGGHNLLEPVVLGVPVITGPYTGNAPDIARALIERGGAVEVRDPHALARELGRLLENPADRIRAARSAQEFVDAHRGAVERLVGLIDRSIEERRPAHPAAAG